MSRWPDRTELERFMARVDRTGEHWLWTGHLNNKGYGVFAVAPPGGGKYIKVLAHRWLYQHVNGPIPHGKELDHLCRVPACVRVEDLEVVTHRENILRGMDVLRASRTHCYQGHLWTPENTRTRADRPRERQCRACARERDARRRRVVA